jgi:hypothetical protein
MHHREWTSSGEREGSFFTRDGLTGVLARQLGTTCSKYRASARHDLFEVSRVSFDDFALYVTRVVR